MLKAFLYPRRRAGDAQHPASPTLPAPGPWLYASRGAAGVQHPIGYGIFSSSISAAGRTLAKSR